MSNTTTHINTKNRLVPELRFKEFEEDWNVKPMGKVTSLLKDGTHGTHKDYPGGIHYLLSAKNIRNGEVNVDESDRTISKQEYDSIYKNYSLKENDILLTIVGTIGRIAKIKDISNIAFQRSVAFFRFENDEPDYLLQFMSSLSFQRELDKRKVISAQPGIYLGDLSKIPIYLASLPEQQKIASFLTAVDCKIQQLTKKKTLLEQYKKGVMQQLFSGQLRFKDNNGNAYPDWEEKKLGEIATKVSSNISANTIEENMGEFKLYGASGLLKKIDFFREEKPYVSIVKDGAGVGRTLLCDANSSVLGTLDIIKPKVDVVLYFLYSVLNNIRFEKYMVGSTIPHIYYKDYSSERIKIPYIKEQQKIATYLSSIDTKIESVTNKITQTQSFKKGLLQQMFV